MFELLLSRKRLRERMLAPTFLDVMHAQVRDDFAFFLDACSALTSESASRIHKTLGDSVSLGE
jgi:hypothetical protein